ncbi:hypothetical protein GTV32_22920 [Gordonia sp. SID5947]|uniref:hypothetical protein n=1 Tax=Gordonia sp. SID5947 TaxID=2690315 RepID=UPI00136A44F3|nr:hypothetical protein [Gordonia sp. SID5947]MYR08989.1 hypothetical protein [Gordonia sp. SID5947]
MGRTRISIRAALIVALVLAILASGAGLGSAAADDDVQTSGQSGQIQTNGKFLPAGFPAPLKQLVAGTDEFKSASWFKGACANRGGDFAAYLAATFPAEPELLFWSRGEDDRAKQLADRYKDNDELSPAIRSADDAKRQMRNGFRPSRDNGWLDPSYPTDKTEDYPSTEPVCADDLARWSTKSISAWGFEFADKPDEGSIKAMAAGNGDVEKAIREPCKNDEADGIWYCMHAFFLDCTKTTNQSDIARCTQWNSGVGRLFRGTQNWIDQNKSFGDRASAAARPALRVATLATMWSNPALLAGTAFSSGWSMLWGQTGGKIKEFFENADGLPEEWANNFKQAAIDMTTTVLPGLATVGDFDLRQPWFLKWYAMSIGLGLAVLAVMFILATVRAARSGGANALAKDTLGYLPTAIAAMMYTPMIAWMLQSLAKAVTVLIAQMMGTSMDEVVNNVSTMLGGLTNETLVGGAVGAIIGFGILAFGAFALFLGLLMHQIGVPLACVACAIGYGMFVHPTWRRKALRVPMMLVSLILSTPLLFIALAVIIQVINWSAAESTTGDGKIAAWGSLALCSLAFFVVGIAPFSLLKWSPLLPNGEDADRMGDSGGGAGQTVGAGMGGAVRASHSGAGRDSGGGSAAGVGGGGQGAHHAAATSHHGSGSPGGAHAAGGSAVMHAGGTALKGAATAGGPVTATAARLASAAGKGGHIAGGMAKAGAAAGTRAGAINASQRAHGVAANSAPTANNS